jgi:tripartite-type tricarboxylate transporter receptor subunit TctC
MNRRTGIAAKALVTVTVLLGVGPAFAQTYPTRYVRIITAGVGTFHDIVARHLARQLSERWGQGVIVENQPAAGLTIGTSMAAKALPDGYTLLLADRTSLAAAPSLYKDLRYDPVKDFGPITLVARAPAILAVNPTVPAGNLREFIAYARQQPDPILFASAGNGTLTHLTGELFAQLAGIKVLPIQYKGGGEAAMALLGDQARFTILSVPGILPQVKAGQVRALAVTSTQRFAGAPEIPTGAEAGLPGLEAEQWVGMLAPAGTPDAIADKLNHDIVEILQTPALKDALRTQGAEAAPSTPAEFASFIASETKRLKRLIETAGLRID